MARRLPLLPCLIAVGAHAQESGPDQATLTVRSTLVNYYVLSFHPTSPAPGLHALHLEIEDRPQLLALKSRTEYWIDNDTAH